MIRWNAEALWEALLPQLPGFTDELLAQVDSTNTELMRRARAGQSAPTLLLAERQHSGRGRLGRSWDSGEQAGAALTFSLGLPLAPRDWAGLSLAVGLALVQALDPQDRGGLRLKWPNDIWLLDEPGANLDDAGRSMVRREARRAADAGKLVLLATNDREEEAVADACISLSGH